ncbi:hypothetical protein SAMN04489752_1819 [Brevibacterium siliguriense]|uniref:Uncharacterized protein n=1 Tax=Brevibacterium siliguriense TaxID=1136497 RepID=A0A1H1SLV1_9MICO|nr:hypothetical protein SAMN04489752_1819 [Brevibacterium siliguriense]
MIGSSAHTGYGPLFGPTRNATFTISPRPTRIHAVSFKLVNSDVLLSHLF